MGYLDELWKESENAQEKRRRLADCDARLAEREEQLRALVDKGMFK